MPHSESHLFCIMGVLFERLGSDYEMLVMVAALRAACGARAGRLRAVHLANPALR